nr:MAG TPA: restriction alleviation protein [Caudoviricetes sp.]
MKKEDWKIADSFLLTMETKKCRFCNESPSLFKKDLIAILRCKCGHSARGYININCAKSEYDLQQSVIKLVRSWNERT